MSMKVIRLQSNNVMRLVAVDITPDGNLVTIGGLNGAGKSSVLNSLAMAIGGKEFVPDEPIRAGETSASIELDLGDLVVVRKFWRERIHQEGFGCGLDITTAEDKEKVCKPCTCKPTYGETESSLIVKNKDGAKYPSPQAMLNKLLGELTFDPLEFSRAKTADERKRQAQTLRELVKLDTTQIDADRKTAFDQRAIQKQTLGIKEAQLIALPKYEGVPAAELSIDDITKEMAEAERLQGVADNARNLLNAKDGAVVIIDAKIADVRKIITNLELELTKAKEQQEKLEQEKLILNQHLITCTAASVAADKAVPDTAALRQRLVDANATNAKVRANATRAKAADEIIEIQNRIEELDYHIKEADEKKAAMLAAAQFPVPGLGLDDTGVTFDGLPFSQASTAEQLRVSVAIGLALNPTLKVLLIRSGNLLDDNSLKLVAEQAAAADAQIWMEYVTSDASDVQVMIEDGHVKQ